MHPHQDSNPGPWNTIPIWTNFDIFVETLHSPQLSWIFQIAQGENFTPT